MSDEGSCVQSAVIPLRHRLLAIQLDPIILRVIEGATRG